MRGSQTLPPAPCSGSLGWRRTSLGSGTPDPSQRSCSQLGCPHTAWPPGPPGHWQSPGCCWRCCLTVSWRSGTSSSDCASWWGCVWVSSTATVSKQCSNAPLAVFPYSLTNPSAYKTVTDVFKILQGLWCILTLQIWVNRRSYCSGSHSPKTQLSFKLSSPFSVQCLMFPHCLWLSIPFPQLDTVQALSPVWAQTTLLICRSAVCFCLALGLCGVCMSCAAIWDLKAQPCGHLIFKFMGHNPSVTILSLFMQLNTTSKLPRHHLCRSPESCVCMSEPTGCVFIQYVQTWKVCCQNLPWPLMVVVMSILFTQAFS